MANTVRITYILLAHKNPQQTGRLIRRLYYPGCRFVLHIDARVPLAAYIDAMGPVPANALRLTRKRLRLSWGTFSIPAAMILGLQDALDWQPDPDFFYFISGQDYPLVSNEHLLNWLADRYDSNFVHYYKPVPGWDHAILDRLDAYFLRIGSLTPFFYPDPNPPSSKRRLLNQVLEKSRLIPKHRPLPLNYEPYFGSSWVQIKPQAGRYLLTFLREHPAFIQRFRYVLVPEEYLFTTIFLNTPNEALRQSIVNYNLTFVHWDRPPEDYARPFTVDDYAMLTQSGKLLARKFDQTVDAAILDQLDERAGVPVASLEVRK